MSAVVEVVNRTVIVEVQSDDAETAGYATQSFVAARVAIEADRAEAAEAGKQPLDSDLTAIAAIDSTQAGVIATDGAGWIRKSYSALKSALALVKADVGLGNVDNTSDVNKPVSTAQQMALNGKLGATAQAVDSAKINGIAVTGIPSSGQVPVATSSSTAAWQSLQITGQYLGSASTFGGLPTSDASGQPAGNGDWAVLNADVVGSGTTANPQYPRGIYIYSGSAYSLALSISADGALLAPNNLADVQDAATARANLGLGSAATQPSSAFSTIGSNSWLIAHALEQGFLLTSNPPTYNSTYGTLTGSNITWPDGTTGVYTATSLDSNGAVTAFTATYVGATTKTVTVTVPRNGSSQVNAPMTATVA